MKPFAIQLYERFTSGETIERLAVALNIPAERIAMRIRAAESYIQQHGRKAAWRNEGEHRMNDTKDRLAEAAAILASLEGSCKQANEPLGLEREIIDRELRDLEQDILADPGALSALLVPVRLRTRRNRRER
jgi:hypothetical protein